MKVAPPPAPCFPEIAGNCPVLARSPLAARSWRHSLFTLGLGTNKTALATVTLSGALTLAIVYLPALQGVFGNVALTPRDLAVALAVSTTVFWSIEIEKWWSQR